jgi:energy-coupling factor transporter ATP-binding protein EcfA2
LLNREDASARPTGHRDTTPPSSAAAARADLAALPAAESSADDPAPEARASSPPKLTAAPPPVDVAGELATWAIALPTWQQHLVAKLLVKETLTDAERQKSVEFLLEAVGGATASATPLSLARHDFPDPVPATDTPKLVGLGPLRNVNAVAEGARLRFEPGGLTVVFGMNAAGKSSYVRPLKRLCRSVHRESEILPNVFAPVRSSDAPTAKVEIRTDATLGTVAKEYKLSVGEETPIGSMSVFDARCASVYVSSENEVAFTPSLLGLLDRLAHEQNLIKGLVEAERAALLAKRAPLPELPAASSAASFVAQLSAKTKDAEIMAQATPLDEVEIQRRDQLQLIVAPAAQQERGRRRAALVAEAEAADELVRRLDALAAAVGPEQQARLETLHALAATARETAQLAAGDAFEIKGLPGVGSTPWQGLWEAARRFVESDLGGTFPPVAEGADCPLCFQELTPEARKRFERFEQFVRGTAEEDARAAAAAVAAARAELRPELINDCRTPMLKMLSETFNHEHNALVAWLERAQARLEALAQSDPAIDRNRTEGVGESEHDGGIPAADPCPHAFIKRFAQARREEIGTLDAAVDPSELAKLRLELEELRGRETLASHAALLRTRVKSLRKDAVLVKASGRLSTRQISIKQRELSERVVTQALVSRLQRELNALNLRHVSIEMNQRARSGAMLLKLRLTASANHQPDEILSEGERRALALAFFLAEIGEPGHDGGAVFDDPVSSLDHERKDAIAGRIAREAARRQVIVFTHDLSFLVRLRYHAEQAGVALGCQTVWRSGSLVGRTTDDLPFDAMKVKQRVGALADELQNLKPVDFSSPDEYQRAISTWYERLRRAWERLVEEVILAGVVERFSPAVHTQQLKNVCWSEEIVERVERGMTRASAWVHDQPTAENATLPGKQEMSTDLEEIRTLLSELRSPKKS